MARWAVDILAAVNSSSTGPPAQSLGIFGYPLAHALSPVIQQAALDHHGIPVRYHAWPVPPSELAGRIAGLRQAEYLGANVTIPHKEAVLPMLDELDPSAAEVGAVNTIVKHDGLLHGHNTDVTGFMTSLKETGGFDAVGKRVLVLGAGGAARAAVFGLANDDVGMLAIANRTVERAQALAGEVVGKVEALVLPLAGPDLDDYVSSVGPHRELYISGDEARRIRGRLAAWRRRHPQVGPRLRHGIHSGADSVAGASPQSGREDCGWAAHARLSRSGGLRALDG